MSRATPSDQPQHARSALWDLGFRPFYLLASFFTAFSVLLWVGQYSGFLPAIYRQGFVWHAYEMLFGYTTAVIAGFLLTAVRNWTNQPTPSGAPLMALAALWIGGRVLILTPFDTAAAVVNAAFPVAIATAIGIPLWKARNVRNYFFVVLLLLLGLLAVSVHLTLQRHLVLPPQATLRLALDVMLFIMVVMGGRVIPMFTNNAIQGTRATRQPWLEKFALGSVLLLMLADLIQLDTVVLAAIALLGAIVHACRLYLWQPWRTLDTPLVWILHAGYAWIVVYLALRGLSELGLIQASLAAHALTIGAIGGLTIGMMSRTARGHTARALRADGYETASYLLVQAAAVVRVLGGLLLPGLYLASVQLSAVLWATAFGLYAVRYWPVLTQPRLDGKPG
ncbi:MAG TPA: NnrS family protein [Burkholderiaceae bacterium]|nr:NnrS family protein [Burkholderiaceae bacterium]